LIASNAADGRRSAARTRAGRNTRAGCGRRRRRQAAALVAMAILLLTAGVALAETGDAPPSDTAVETTNEETTGEETTSEQTTDERETVSVDEAGEPDDVGDEGTEPTVGVIIGPGQTVHDIQAAGSLVVVEGTVEGNLTAAAVHVREGGIVTGHVTIDVYPHQHASLDLGGLGSGAVQVNGKVGGNIRAHSIILLSQADIGGNLYVEGPDLQINRGAQVGGRIEYIGDGSGTPFIVAPSNVVTSASVSETDALSRVNWRLASLERELDRLRTPWRLMGWGLAWLPCLLAIAGLGALVYAITPDLMRTAAENAAAGPIRCFLAGLLTLLAVGPAFAVMAVTIIGLPLIPLAGGALAYGTVAGGAAIGCWLGIRLWGLARDGERPPELYGLLLGTVVLAQLVWLPVLGWLALTLISVAGLGAVMLEWYPRLRAWWRRRRARNGNGGEGPDAPGVQGPAAETQQSRPTGG